MYAVNAYRFVEQLSKIDIALTARRTNTHTHTQTHNVRGGRTERERAPASPKGDSRENQYGEILSLAECFPGIVPRPRRPRRRRACALSDSTD